MTDARFPERWLNDRRIIRLTDSAFRTFVLGMTWAVANRSDGYVSSDDLDLVHGAEASDADELVKASLWSRADDAGYWIEDFTRVQTSAAQLDGLEHKKAQDRARAKKYRAKKDGTDPDPDPSSSRDASRDGSRDSSRDDIGQDRPGQDRPRTGQALHTGEGPTSRDVVLDEQTGEVSTTPVTPSVTRNSTSDDPSSEPCFSCGIRPAVNGSDCLACSSGGSDLQHQSVSEPTTRGLAETPVSSGADRNADHIPPNSPPDRPATAHRAPVVPPPCAVDDRAKCSTCNKHLGKQEAEVGQCFWCQRKSAANAEVRRSA